MPRLFVAIDLDEPVRAFVQRAAGLLASAGVHGRFELAEKFHVTLAFLGATPAERVTDALAALQAACRKCAAFDLGFDMFGIFPHERRARIVWVGPRHTPAGFVRCGDAVFDALERAGWSLDRKPQPHVTICRLKEAPPGPLPRLESSASLHATGLSLYESRPAGPTTRYVQLEWVPFG